MKLRCAVILALALSYPAQALAGLAAPVALAPDDGAVFSSAPAVGWSPVTGADHYSVSFASDAGFASPVLSGQIATVNTWATLKKAVPPGEYWWRVRAVTKGGVLGPWSSPATSFQVSVGASPAITAIAPTSGSTITFPTLATVRWTPIAGAASYRIKAGSDPGLTAIDGVKNWSQKTDAAAYTFGQSLTPGETYYWQVVPVDAEKNEGTPSAVFSFTWAWNSTTTTRYVNLRDPSGSDPDPPVVDPQFSWDPIPGAVRYEIIVSSATSLTDSIYLDETTVGTRFSPVANLPNNVYYWEVRGIDAGGHNGVWNRYTAGAGSVLKSFYTSTSHPITNLRLVDNTGADVPMPMPIVSSPIVTWDPMPGASAYEVEVTRAIETFDGQGTLVSAACTNSIPTEYWDDLVATNAWTPLGSKPRNTKGPWPSTATLTYDATAQFVAGHQYCVRVRPYSDDSLDSTGLKSHVFGAWTWLDGGYGAPAATISFGFSGYGSCTSPCPIGYPSAGSYLLPAPGSTAARTPFFTWQADPAASGYWVIVAQDASLTNVIDYAYVLGTAYAPRAGATPVSYPDESTRYYWAVLPSSAVDGSIGPSDATQANPQSFIKSSTPPSLIGPLTNPPAGQRPTFQWSLAEGARTYLLQVASDAQFSTVVQSVRTPATSYSPEITYPAGDLFWRVAAVDWDGIQLAWSAVGSFRNVLQAPTVPAQLDHAEMIPTWFWNAVPGASGYLITTMSPSGAVASTTRTWGPYVSAGTTFVKLDGTGSWGWSVQAVFPAGTSSTVPGDPSPVTVFDNTMSAPTSPSSANGGHGLLLSWAPKTGAARYKLQVSSHQDMQGAYLESVTVDSPAYAPLLGLAGYKDGGRLYWQVAAQDETGNVGAYTAVQSFVLPARMVARATGFLRKGKRSTITVSVSDILKNALAGATVRISGAGLAKVLHTGSGGGVVLKATPRKRGSVTITVSKPGYQTTTLLIVVR